MLTEQAANEAGKTDGDEYFAELDYIEVMENFKEGYEEDVEMSEENSDDEDFDYDQESSARNDDSDDEFVARSCATIQKSYRTRHAKRREDNSKQKDLKKSKKDMKKQNSVSDDEDDVRQVRNIMVSHSLSSNEDEDDRKKTFRKLFGTNETVYIMDAKKSGNIGRYFNVSQCNQCFLYCIRVAFCLVTTNFCTSFDCSTLADQICLCKMYSSIRMICVSLGSHSLHHIMFELEQS